MTDTIKMEDIIEPTSDSPVEETVETIESTTQQNPLQVELEKVQEKKGKSELEKATFSIKKTAERIKELGGDPNTILRIEKEGSTDDEDDKPLTMGMFKRMELEKAGQSAMQLAESITSEAERELTKYHLENTIKTTGNPQEDLKLARTLVNAVKNTQIIEEAARKPEVKTHSSAASAPANHQEDNIELSPAEMPFTKAPFNMTKEAIIAVRPKS